LPTLLSFMLLVLFLKFLLSFVYVIFLKFCFSIHHRFLKLFLFSPFALLPLDLLFFMGYYISLVIDFYLCFFK
jgi:hypothetical protein